jgi:hypothetical protein
MYRNFVSCIRVKPTADNKSVEFDALLRGLLSALHLVTASTNSLSVRSIIARVSPRRYALFHSRSGSASHRQNSMNESKQSPYFKNRWYLCFDLLTFFAGLISPIISVPRKHPI